MKKSKAVAIIEATVKNDPVDHFRELSECRVDNSVIYAVGVKELQNAEQKINNWPQAINQCSRQSTVNK
jgi:hypothetical protein